MKFIAFYLPQFHSEPLNEKIWGREFTDWVTSQSAEPLYLGHNQPKVPSFPMYDLVVNEDVINTQINQAKEIGIDAFNFYFYSFNSSQKALRKPVENFLHSTTDFPFMLTWANHSWTKAWVGENKKIIAKQLFDNNQVDVFAGEIVEYLIDSRYLHHESRPVIGILNTNKLDVAYLKQRVEEELYLISGKKIEPYIVSTFDSSGEVDRNIDLYIGWPPGDIGLVNIQNSGLIKKLLRPVLSKLDSSFCFKSLNRGCERNLLKKQLEYAKDKPNEVRFSQTLLTGWDNTPRYNYRGYEIIACDEDDYIIGAGAIVGVNKLNEVPFTFIKAWNEWAEGNVLENSINSVDYAFRMKRVIADAKL